MIDARLPGLYLASRSPRRRELLAQIDVRFELLDAEVDESVRGAERPADYVERLARAKADAAWARIGREGLRAAPVLAADTTVTLEGRILGKPADRREAAKMLCALSGQRHEVFTAVAVRSAAGLETAVSRSEVAFRVLESSEIRQYLESGEADDKAGAYAIQGRAAQFIVELRGSYSGVVGLPLFETARLLERLASH